MMNSNRDLSFLRNPLNVLIPNDELFIPSSDRKRSNRVHQEVMTHRSKLIVSPVSDVNDEPVELKVENYQFNNDHDNFQLRR